MECDPIAYATGGCKEVRDWLKRTGIVSDEDNLQKVIIEIDFQDIVRIYKQEIGTLRVFAVSPPDLSKALTVKSSDRPSEQ